MADGTTTATPDHEFFEELLASSVAAHGHLCAGQVVGVRMALLGLRLLNFEAPPTLPQLKRLLVYVEMDRCTGDAVAHTTGVKLGRRSLKFVDYGIMAATFVDLETSQGLPGHLHRRIPGPGRRSTLLWSPIKSGNRCRPIKSCRTASCFGSRK